jgi:hypothetical protein
MNPSQTLLTPTGLALTLDGCAITAATARDRNLLAGTGGFYVRDVAAGGKFVPFDNAVRESLGLELTFDTQAENAIIIAGRVQDLTGTDRAITLRFALPLELAGWVWHDDVRKSRRISPDQRYIHAVDIKTGVKGEHSLYPLGAITDDDLGLGMAMDMMHPAQCRICVEGGQFVLEYDLGLAAETDAFPSAAEFRFVVFDFDARWEFRGALARFYKLFPEQFVRRVDEHGAWMPFASIKEVDGWEDFGFKFHEGAENNQWHVDNGIGNFRYTEPSTWWMNIPNGMERTPENVERMIHQYAEGDDEKYTTVAQVTLRSVAHDEQSRMQFQSRDLPWCHGVCFSSNPNPHLPEPCEGKTLLWDNATKARLYGPNSPDLQAGEYLDSLEAYATEEENHRREHFHYVTVPLTFSSKSHKPCIHKASSVFEFCKVLANDLHEMGKRLFCNSAPEKYAFLCPFFDIMGIEVEWVDKAGQWDTPSDAECNFKRAMLYRRPYALLLNTPFEKLTPPVVETYFQTSLFYGMVPSMFSHNAAEDIYWGRPEWYNRDRAFFVKYMPLCCEVSQAGWEPIPHATSDNGEVWIERFGPNNEGRVFLAIMNASQSAQSAMIHVDGPSLGATLSQTVTDDISGVAMEIVDNTFHVALEPQQVMRLTLGG